MQNAIAHITDVATAIKLTRIKSKHNNLRTDEIEGLLMSDIRVGEPVIIHAPPLESGSIRLITTTPVQVLIRHTLQEQTVGFTIRTDNSEYLLEFI